VLVRPFAALRPSAATASRVIAPPYDVVDTDEARALAAGRPESFLHISRPEIDLPPGTDPHGDAVYATGRRNLERLIATHVLERDARPCFYVYRMTMGAHTQTGFAAAASVQGYEQARIHRHELTRPDKEDDRVRNIVALNAQTGPVLLAYKANATVDGLLARHSALPPLFEARGQHDVLHAVWRIDNPGDIAQFQSALDALADLYIADGHHRSAAAARIAAARRGSISRPAASHEFFLSVAFPDDQMRIFDYNRIVMDLNGLSAADFVAAVGKVFRCTPLARGDKPASPRQFGMYLDRCWYRLEAPEARPDASPVARLDVSRLQDAIIAPLLGIADPRTDSRIGFVGGVRGLRELERRVDGGDAAVAFALFPTQMRELMDVADAGLLMPPKSTWFEPKLADGLLSHVLD
jgi:uncharacterized protein (DUF1015 family)